MGEPHDQQGRRALTRSSRVANVGQKETRQIERMPMGGEDENPLWEKATRKRLISSSSCASESAILIRRQDAAHLRTAPPTRRRPDDATTRPCLPWTHRTTERCLVTTLLNGTKGCVWKISGDMFVTGSYGKKMDGQGRRRNRLCDVRRMSRTTRN